MAQQLSRSPALGAPQRRTCPPCAFQKSKLLPSRAAPHKTTPTVPSSSPAQAARPLPRPLRSASDDQPTWAEDGRDLLWSIGTGVSAMALLAIFCTLLPITPDNRHLHFGLVLVLCIRSTRESARSSTSSSSVSTPLWSASVFDDHPTSPPSSPWAKALHSLRRFKAGDTPMSWADVLTFLLWDFGSGLLGVATLAYILPWHPSSTPDTFTIFHPAMIWIVLRWVTPRR